MKKNEFYKKATLSLGKLRYLGYEEVVEYIENKETGRSERTDNIIGLKIKVLSVNLKETFEVKIEDLKKEQIEDLVEMQEVGFVDLNMSAREQGYTIDIYMNATDLFAIDEEQEEQYV